MLLGTIIGIILATLVAYAVFRPYKSTWNTDMYDEPQSFTDAGISAEWGTPLEEEVTATPEELPVVTPVELPKVIISNAGYMHQQYTEEQVANYPIRRARKKRSRTTTCVGWLAPNNSPIIGVKPMNRSELAEMIHKDLCSKGCTGVERYQETLTCLCGSVSRYANASGGLSSGISRQ